MEPGSHSSSRSALSRSEVTAFWKSIELPKRSAPAPLTVEEHSLFGSKPKPPKPARNVLAQQLKQTAWERTRTDPGFGVARAWVYRVAEKERLFLLFTQPLPSGFPPVVPDDLVEVDQPGRWEMVNPRTLCFQPTEAVLRFERLLVKEQPQPVEGREP